MYAAYGKGGVLLGYGDTLPEAIAYLANVVVGWVTCQGQIVERKGF